MKRPVCDRKFLSCLLSSASLPDTCLSCKYTIGHVWTSQRTWRFAQKKYTGYILLCTFYLDWSSFLLEILNAQFYQLLFIINNRLFLSRSGRRQISWYDKFSVDPYLHIEPISTEKIKYVFVMGRITIKPLMKSWIKRFILTVFILSFNISCQIYTYYFMYL